MELPRELRDIIYTFLPRIVLKPIRHLPGTANSPFWPTYSLESSILQTCQAVNAEVCKVMKRLDHRHPPTIVCSVPGLQLVIHLSRTLYRGSFYDTQWLKLQQHNPTTEEPHIGNIAVDVPSQEYAESGILGRGFVMSNFRKFLRTTIIRLRHTHALQVVTLIEINRYGSPSTFQRRIRLFNRANSRCVEGKVQRIHKTDIAMVIPQDNDPYTEKLRAGLKPKDVSSMSLEWVTASDDRVNYLHKLYIEDIVIDGICTCFSGRCKGHGR